MKQPLLSRAVSTVISITCSAIAVAAQGDVTRPHDPPPQAAPDKPKQQPAPPARPQDPKAEEQEPAIPVDAEADQRGAAVRFLSLEDAMQIGRLNNVGLRAAELLPMQARLDLIFSEAAFEPELYSWSATRTPSPLHATSSNPPSTPRRSTRRSAGGSASSRVASSTWPSGRFASSPAGRRRSPPSSTRPSGSRRSVSRCCAAPGWTTRWRR
jgi:hypothetical protein